MLVISLTIIILVSSANSDTIDLQVFCNDGHVISDNNTFIRSDNEALLEDDVSCFVGQLMNAPSPT